MGDSLQEEAGDDVQVLQDKLVDEFRAKLDDTLVIAIIGDFDLSNHEQFDQARSILNGLAQDVVTEEASGFNPSAIGDDRVGTVGYAEGLEGQQRPANPNSSNSTTGSAGLVTDFTEFTDFSDTLSERFATLDFPKDVNVATLDDDGKVAELKVMFPVLGELDIKLALKKGKGDFIKACEELLNMQYLEENGLRPKGIDGAFRLDGHVGYKVRPENTKDKGKNLLDIDYRLTPLDLSEEDRSTAVPAMSASKPLARRNSLPRIIPVTSTAARAPVSAPDSPAIKPTQWQVVESKRKIRSDFVPDVPPGYDPAESLSETLSAAGRAWRRGGLYRPVAGVLAERAREQREIIKAFDSHRYDAMVDQTASANRIDLHGLPVADGVRIALERTQLWWSNLGEDRIRRAREEGFTIVTGMGNHSTSGVSRMRQDVGAALKREGWRTNTGTGQYTVTGKT